MRSARTLKLCLALLLFLSTTGTALADSFSCLATQSQCQRGCGNDRTCVRSCYEEAQECINGSSSRSSSRYEDDDSDTDDEEDAPSYSSRTYRVPAPTQSTRSSSPSAKASNDYPPADCVRVSTNQYNEQELRNICNFDIEAHWRDTKGGWNSWSIPAGRAYVGGSRAVRAYACVKNDYLDKNTMMCTG
jgi:hypothetical protein